MAELITKSDTYVTKEKYWWEGEARDEFWRWVKKNLAFADRVWIKKAEEIQDPIWGWVGANKYKIYYSYKITQEEKTKAEQEEKQREIEEWLALISEHFWIVLAIFGMIMIFLFYRWLKG